MANPLPNTKAPAFAKKAPSWPKSVQSKLVATAQVDGQCGVNAMRLGAELQEIQDKLG
jgi:hypothetical protein